MADREDDWQVPEDGDDDAPSAEELAEAQALARALDRGVSPAVSDEALEAAALLRISQQPDLNQQRADALWEEVQSQAKFSAGAAAADGRPRWLWALLPMLAGAAAILVVLDVGEPADGFDGPPLADASIPAPPAALLEAQADYMNSDDPEAREAFEQRMGEYRSAVLASLEEHYR